MIKKKKNREIQIFIICILISLGLVFIDKKSWLNSIKRPLENLGNLVREKLYNVSLRTKTTSNKLQTDKDVTLLKDLRDELERENANLKVVNENLKQENEDLKRQIQAPLPADWKLIPAKVVGTENGIFSINQGSDVGLREGQIAVFENILMGKLIQVTPRTAKILLPIHKDFEVKAKIVENDGKGVVKSERGNQIILNDVLQEVELKEGQIVVTSGEEERFPEDLLIGKIDKVEKEETAVYQKAVLQPLVDYNNLSNVFIIID